MLAVSNFSKLILENETNEEKKEGFLTWNPSEEELEKIINDSGIYISVKGEKLRGYLITMSKERGRENPFFSEMLSYSEKMEFEGRTIADYNYVIFAQICIAKEFRGGMTFSKLHFTAQSSLKDQYDIWIGEIADTNTMSLKVHSNYTDAGVYDSKDGVTWHVFVGDLRDD